MLFVTALVSGCGADRVQMRLCEQIVRALEHESGSVEMLQAARHPQVDQAVIIDYRVMNANGDATDRWISCRFAGGSPATGPRDLIGVTTDRSGPLPIVDVAMLQIWLRLSDGEGFPRPGVQSPLLGASPDNPVYVLQHLVNAIPLISIYALMALGFSIALGVMGSISLPSRGALTAVAGCIAVLGISWLVVISTDSSVVAIAAVLLLVAAAWAFYRWLADRKSCRSVWGSFDVAWGPSTGTQAALVATLGAAIFLREAMQFAEDVRGSWLESAASVSKALVYREGVSVMINFAQLIILAIAAAVVGVLSLVMTESYFGRHYRTSRSDSDMTALAVVDVDRAVSRAVLAGAVSIGVAGALTTLYYGTVSATTGILIALKGLTAAAIGGFGSIGGAVIGGIALAVFETLWAAYSSHDRNLAVFALIAVLLLLRPGGLFSR